MTYEELANLYSETAEQDGIEIDKRMRELNSILSKLTPEELDSWDPEDDYIPELDDIKAPELDDSKTPDTIIEKWDEPGEWEDSYNLNVNTSIPDEALDIILNSDECFKGE